MKKLKENFTKNAMTYNLVRRDEKKAIYSVAIGTHTIGYEVFKIRVRAKRFSAILNIEAPSYESYPNNESFGYTAWTYKTLNRAIKKYNSL